MAQYDLTRRHAKFLDLHMVLPMLEFVQSKEVYNEKDILGAKLELLDKTNMIDFMKEEFVKLHKREPEGIEDKKAAVIEQLNKLNDQVQPVIRALEALDERGADISRNVLIEEFGVTTTQIELLYDLAQHLFSIANYSAAGDFLMHYTQLTENKERLAKARWGHFATDILTQRWPEALEDLKQLREALDSEQLHQPPVKQVQHRAWLMHWSLFVFFNHESGRLGIIDLFMQDRYLGTLQNVCPHLLRYLVTAVITSTQRQDVMARLVRVVEQQSYEYKDPITEFVECLYLKFDFEAAQAKLKECEAVLQNDFFLVACRDDFIDNARLSIFETYCRIHQCIHMQMLADKLGLSADEAEKWIVTSIREGRISAKVDSVANRVIMIHPQPSVHQLILSQTCQMLRQSMSSV